MAKPKSKTIATAVVKKLDYSPLDRRARDTLATLIDSQRTEIFGVQAVIEVLSKAASQGDDYPTHRVTNDAAKRLDEIAGALEMIMYQVEGSIFANPIPTESA